MGNYTASALAAAGGMRESERIFRRFLERGDLCWEWRARATPAFVILWLADVIRYAVVEISKKYE